MFNNVGEKLKKDAKLFFAITSVLGSLGAIVSLLYALIENSFVQVAGYLIPSILLLCVNALVARLIYGVGILVAKEEASQGGADVFDIE